MQTMQAVAVSTRSSKGAHGDLDAVVQQMTRLYVAGLPRNYELFHEALSGHNPDLTHEVLALGAHPSQSALDDIGFKHRLLGHCGVAAGQSQSEAARLLRGIGEHLSLGLTQKRTFIRALETVARSLREDSDHGLADILSEMEFLQSSTKDLLLGEADLGQKLQDGVQKLELVEKGVAAVQATTRRDRLTGLPNRIAFSGQISDLYNSDMAPLKTALILVDIDYFKSINDKYGQAAGNKLLKRLGAIFRKSIKKNDFVARTGGDEFAFLFDDVSREAATAIAERLRVSVEDNLVFATGDDGGATGLTISLGIALSDDAESAQQLQAHAQAALTAATGNARSPVMIYTHGTVRSGAKA